MSKSRVGEKPTIIVAHSLGVIVVKKILAYAAKGDPRVQPLLRNLKGVVFISGPNNGTALIAKIQEQMHNLIGLTLRFDAVGELAVSPEEANDYIMSGLCFSKSTYYVSRREKNKFRKLQADFKYVHA